MQVLAGVFLAYATSGVEQKFNTNDEWVATELQHKKKVAVKGKGRGKTVKASLISTMPKCAKKVTTKRWKCPMDWILETF